MTSGMSEAFVNELDTVGWDPEPCRWLERGWGPKLWRLLESGWDSKHSLMRQRGLVVPKPVEAVDAEWDSKPFRRRLV